MSANSRNTETAGPGTDAWNKRVSPYLPEGTLRDKLIYAIGYAVLAPSGHNTQPWLFHVGDASIDLRADRTRALPVVDSIDRELTMSCGAALLHLRVVLGHFGIDVEVQVLPESSDPDLLARLLVRTDTAVPRLEHALVDAIFARRTNRSPFHPDPLSVDTLGELTKSALQESAELHFLTTPDDKQAVARLVAEGDRIQMADPAFRRELADWLHHNHSDSLDGMRGFSFGIGDLMSYAGAFVIRTFDMGNKQAAKDHELAMGSPVIAVLHTASDEPGDWMQAGQALARVLLRATALGVSASYLNQPIELAQLRPKLARLTCGDARVPQILLRLGRGGESLPAVPRRPVEEVLL